MYIVKDENLKELADIAGAKNLVNCCKFERFWCREIRRKNTVMSASPSQKLTTGTRWWRRRQSKILPLLPPSHVSHPILCMSICHSLSLSVSLLTTHSLALLEVIIFSLVICVILDSSKEGCKIFEGVMVVKWGFWGVYTRTKKWQAIRTWQDKSCNR